MALLSIALAIAEEWLIQQTSLAPLVIQLKGETYARAFGVNYVYFLWALIYEPVLVVILPVHLVGLIFPAHRDGPWLGKKGLWMVIPLFLMGSFLAWYTWTQIARPKVFHLPAYPPSLVQIVIAVAAICLLIFLALKTKSKKPVSLPVFTKPPSALASGLFGGIWAVLLFGLLLLGLGIAPDFPPAAAIGPALFLLAALPVYLLPRFWNNGNRFVMSRYGLICGTIVGAMGAGQFGFIGASRADLLFKIVTNIIAVILLTVLWFKLKKQARAHFPDQPA